MAAGAGPVAQRPRVLERTARHLHAQPRRLARTPARACGRSGGRRTPAARLASLSRERRHAADRAPRAGRPAHLAAATFHHRARRHGRVAGRGRLARLRVGRSARWENNYRHRAANRPAVFELQPAAVRFGTRSGLADGCFARRGFRGPAGRIPLALVCRRGCGQALRAIPGRASAPGTAANAVRFYRDRGHDRRFEIGSRLRGSSPSRGDRRDSRRSAHALRAAHAGRGCPAVAAPRAGAGGDLALHDRAPIRHPRRAGRPAPAGFRDAPAHRGSRRRTAHPRPDRRCHRAARPCRRALPRPPAL
jgi:hypothetical protein